MNQNLLRKNWGFYLGVFERAVIFTVGIWTFLNFQTPNIEEKGLIFRQAVFIILIFIIPCLALGKRIPLKEFPFKTDAIILSPLLLDTIGNFSTHFILSYDRWGFFDKVAHFWGSGVLTFLFFVILISYFYAKNKKPRIFYFFWLSLAISIIAAGLWEILEYCHDLSRGTILVGGWSDVIGDMVAGFFGSLIASSLCCFWYVRSKIEAKQKYLSAISLLLPVKMAKDKSK